MTPDEHAEELAHRGLEALLSGRLDEAVVAFEEAVSRSPDRPDLAYSLGVAHLQRGEIDRAIERLTRGRALADRVEGADRVQLERDVHVSLATAWLAADRVPEAVAELEDAAAKWPHWLPARRQLAYTLLSGCRLEGGRAMLAELLPRFDAPQRERSESVLAALEIFDVRGGSPEAFLRAHAAAYRERFDAAVEARAGRGFLAEAARMVAGPDGTTVPAVAPGARPWARSRVDLVHRQTHEVVEVASASEPMIVELDGLEPLARVAVPIRAPDTHPFELWISTRCAWHWLPIAVQLAEPLAAERRTASVEPAIEPWFLAGYRGEFGPGRFHEVVGPLAIGETGVRVVVDLGRAGDEAIPDLLARLAALDAPIVRVLVGEGHLP